jgi:LacI family repressor for deo operon, udp, cdd, tsx, nupC, and nupG
MNKVETQTRRSKGRGITIFDVARKAGVSTATVSRALAFPDRVAEETRAAVFAAIAEVGYTPNASARNLRAKRSRMVLALVPGMDNAFFTPILNAIEDQLSDAGYGLIMGDTRNDARKEFHYARIIRAGQVDGVVLLIGHLPKSESDHAIEGLLPISIVLNEIKGANLPLFDVANRKAARTMVNFLISQGHRRIAHIRGPEGHIEANERVKGYGDALKAAGIPVEPELIWPGDFFPGSGKGSLQRFFAMSNRPTAVFASNDQSAIGFIKSLKDAGLSVPNDVSVAGFDDIGFLELFIPGLTTMRQPLADLGRLAALDLLNRIENSGKSLPAARVRLECELVIRESVARPQIIPRRSGRAGARIAR